MKRVSDTSVLKRIEPGMSVLIGRDAYHPSDWLHGKVIAVHGRWVVVGRSGPDWSKWVEAVDISEVRAVSQDGRWHPLSVWRAAQAAEVRDLLETQMAARRALDEATDALVAACERIMATDRPVLKPERDSA